MGGCVYGKIDTNGREMLHGAGHTTAANVSVYADMPAPAAAASYATETTTTVTTVTTTTTI